jgi:hypothetical protein
MGKSTCCMVCALVRARAHQSRALARGTGSQGTRQGQQGLHLHLRSGR